MQANEVEILNAVFTPMFSDGSVNYQHVPALFQQCLLSGANGVFLNGTTGECMSLSVEERINLVSTWVNFRNECNVGNFKIVVHVGSCNLRETAQMAEHAQAIGAEGIAMVPTFYFKPNTLDELIEQCVYVAAAAPAIPFYYYSIPSFTGVQFPLLEFMEKASKKIPSFAGLKNSFSDVSEYQRCIHFAKNNYHLYWGSDDSFMMLYIAGNRRYVGSTYNYMGNMYHSMLNAFRRSDMEALLALEAEADAIYKVILSPNPLVNGKEIMGFMGIDCGPVRRPLKPFSKPDSDDLLKRLNGTTFFKYIPTKG